MSSASSFHASLLQTINGVMSLALCWLSVNSCFSYFIKKLISYTEQERLLQKTDALKNSHGGCSTGSSCVEHREGVDDEAQLFVRQKGVDQNVHHSWQGQRESGPGKPAAPGHQHQRSHQCSWQNRVEVPPERGSLE